MVLKTIIRSQWTLLAIVDQHGHCDVMEYIEQYVEHNSDASAMMRTFERVSQYGPYRDNEKSKQLTRNIYEFRRGQLRVLYFYDKGMLIICTQPFIKKCKKTPRSEIERAECLCKLYRYDQLKGDITFIT